MFFCSPLEHHRAITPTPLTSAPALQSIYILAVDMRIFRLHLRQSEQLARAGMPDSPHIIIDHPGIQAEMKLIFRVHFAPTRAARIPAVRINLTADFTVEAVSKPT